MSEPGSTNAAGLRLDALSVARGGRAVVRDVSLEIPPGEVTTLLGANGAGKSTLVLAVAGVLRPSGGRVLLGDVDLTRPPARADPHRRASHRPRGTAAAARADGRGQPARRDVRAQPRGGGAAGSSTRSSSSRSSRSAGTRRPGCSPGGEQQMVVLAQALVSQPKIVLVDELSLGLAPVVVKRLVPTLEAVAARGVGVLLIEQFAHVALGLAENAYVLEGGRIRYHGPAQTAQGRARAPSLGVSAARHEPRGRDRLGGFGGMSLVVGASSAARRLSRYVAKPS